MVPTRWTGRKLDPNLSVSRKLDRPDVVNNPMKFEKWTKSGVPEEATLEVGHHVSTTRGIGSRARKVDQGCASALTFLLLVNGR